MIKKVIRTILKRFDESFEDATQKIAGREAKLVAFSEAAFADMKKFVLEFQDVDERVTVEEKPRSMVILYKGDILFRVSVPKYSERSEIIIDSQRLIVYDGMTDYEYVEDDKFSLAAKSAILESFKLNIRRSLEKELRRL